MTQYVLHVSSWSGLVPGAVHFRGRVEGPYPGPCHEGTVRYNAPEARGKMICSQGHELPEQVKWDVEMDWPEEQRERYLAACSKALRLDAPHPDGPQQFTSEKDVMERAVEQFLDGMKMVNDPAQEGDELWYGWVNPGGDMWDDLTDAADGWGCMIARKNTGGTTITT